MVELIHIILDAVFSQKKLNINIPKLEDVEKKAFFKSLLPCIIYCIKSGNSDIYIKSKYDNKITVNNVLKLINENYIYVKSITVKPRTECTTFSITNDEPAITKDEYNELLKEYFMSKCNVTDKSTTEIYNKLSNYCAHREIKNKETIDQLIQILNE